MKPRTMVRMAMLSALSVILVYFIHFPIFPAFSFFEYDAGDIPIFLSSMIYGPLPGLAVTIITSIVQAFTVSSRAGIIGCIMHIFATGTYALVMGLICKKFKNTIKTKIFASLLAALSMVIVMIFWNLLITPLYTGMTRENVMSIMLPVIIPFNAIKASTNTIIALALYITLSKIKSLKL